MAISTKVNEGSFEARFDAGDFAFIDVGFLLFTSAGLNVQVVQALAIYQSNTQLFRLSGVN